MPNQNCMVFTFNGFGYMLQYNYVCSFSWTNPNWPGGATKGGDIIFSVSEAKLIRMWKDRDGWGDLTLEEFLGGLSE